MKIKCIIIIVFFLFPSERITAQIGFFDWYDMNTSGNSFYSINQMDERLFVYGSARDTTIATWWGVQLIELDTHGMVVNQFSYVDPAGAHVATNGIIQGGLLTMNEKGEMACTGGFLGSGRNTYVLKADTSLSWYQLYELTDSSINTNIAYNISSYEGGYLVSGTRTKYGIPEIHGFVMHLTNTLEVGWNYFNPLSGSRGAFRGGFKRGNNFFAGGSITYLDNFGNTIGRHSIINQFDTNGVLVNQWQSEEVEEISMLVFKDAPDGGFINSSWDVIYHPNSTFSLFPRVVRRDSTYQKLWEVELPVSGSDQNRVMGITRSLDGHWLVTAKLYTELAGSPGIPRMAPCVFKISDEGEILWSTCVTFPYEWVNNQYPSFRVGNVIQISTGSMYVVGNVNRSNPSRTLGWMLKLDKDGCLNENPCHPPPDTTVSISNPNLLSANNEGKLDIYPNPTSSTATVQIPGPGRLALYDLQGRQLRQEAIPAYQLDSPTAHELQINTHSLPAGMYMLVFYGDDGFVYRGKLGVF